MDYKEIIRKKHYYVFSLYLICSCFSNVVILLVVLANVFWVRLEKTCFVNEGSVQGKRLQEGFYQEAGVSSDSVGVMFWQQRSKLLIFLCQFESRSYRW